MGMESTLKSSVMIAIFVVAIITFSVQFALDNDSDISIAGDSRFGNLDSSLRGNVTQLSEDSKTSQSILEKTSLSAGDQEISGGGGQFKIGPYTAMTMTIASLRTGFNTIFGDEFGFVIIAFVSLFVFLLGYYVIKAWLGKDPD
jgi:hypothetical protein